MNVDDSNFNRNGTAHDIYSPAFPRNAAATDDAIEPGPRMLEVDGGLAPDTGGRFALSKSAA